MATKKKAAAAPAGGKARIKAGRGETRVGSVVGIGASAGGLEALRRVFANMRADTGLAFVVVQHLSPDHKSLMGELLAKDTAMPVVEATEGLRPEPDHVYLLPPGRTMVLQGGRLRLSTRRPSGSAGLPIDIVFESLAADLGGRAAAVVLSGTGTDGSRGVQAIKRAGGVVVVQDPATARFDGMPLSAIATGAVDDVVPPEAVGPRLVAGAKSRRRPPDPEPGGAAETVPRDAMAAIMAALEQATGVDFTHYKQSTLSRRIERRVHATHAATIEDYAALLQGNPGEAAQLYRDLLIGVTRFFRDPGAWRSLASGALATLVSEVPDGGAIRAWVCGCASGEEAYGLAILLSEELERQHKSAEVKVFATDVDHESIAAAAAGVYHQPALDDIPPEWLAKYFIRRDGHHAVARHLRQMVVFARHNVLKDPPFTKLDLITCRNLLIYLEPVLQRKVLARFHYGLRGNGLLMLGASESLGELATEFTPVDARHKLFQAAPGAGNLPAELSPLLPAPTAATNRERRLRPVQSDQERVIDQGLSLLVEGYAPPALLVDDRNEVLHVFGGASRLLTMPSGAATLDLSRLLPEGLGALASSALRRAHRGGREIRCPSLDVRVDGRKQTVRLRVRPFADGQGRQFALLVFEPTGGEGADLDAAALELEADAADRIRGLEAELAASREDLQSTVEELETSNEELQAANEELIASNEELQSTNEELQSVNEELYTVNSEYEAKIEELTRLNDDLDNLFRATDLATVFLDQDMLIRRFTPAAGDLLNLMPSDIGRPLAHIQGNLVHDGLLQDVRDVLLGARPIGREVRILDGRWMLSRIQPYTVEQIAGREPRAFGTVITFVEITKVKQAEHRLQAVLDSLPELVVVLDRQGTMSKVNKAWIRYILRNGVDLGESHGVGRRYADICDDLLAHAGEAAEVAAGLRRLLAGDSDRFVVEAVCGEGRRMLVQGVPVGGSAGDVVVSHTELTRALADREAKAT